MRARYESLWEKRFDQAHIACLTDDLVADMTAACDNAFRLAEDGAEPSIFLLGGLLRLVHPRIEPQCRRHFFTRLLKLGDQQSVKANCFAGGAREKAIKEIGRQLDPLEIKDMLVDVLTFPLPSEVKVRIVDDDIVLDVAQEIEPAGIFSQQPMAGESQVSWIWAASADASGAPNEDYLAGKQGTIARRVQEILTQDLSGRPRNAGDAEHMRSPTIWAGPAFLSWNRAAMRAIG